MGKIDYTASIPNNVGIADDRRLQRALESWQPAYAAWWSELGPVGFQDKEVYLRTAVDVGREGWAHFDYVKMPDYRWGVFLSEPEPNRTIGFGDMKGGAAWQEVPGEFRADLRRLIVVQGDTEPASVEQQRHLGLTAPSLYDLRNLFQVNVEEGRHLWAMVYLLHRHFGSDGRDEADAMLERHSGDPDRPRILGAFNEPTPDWLSFFMFTYFTDRDGKYQLGALRESAFDPLSRTCDFMLKEEAHHMFVGASGVGRVVQRTAELMNAFDTADVEPHGGINLDTLQRYINFHFSVSLDLFGSELSTNAANYYASGIKGRFAEQDYDDDHVLTDGDRELLTIRGDRLFEEVVPARSAVNADLRDDYIADCAKGLRRWNRILDEHDIDTELALPHMGFNREVGAFSSAHITPDGTIVGTPEWAQRSNDWLPSKGERAHVSSLMSPQVEPGQMADWIAPPSRGINTRPVDYEYVRL
ncbi:MAG: benzoyl-CoA 2,3-epoxidase subunit BoxB [Actinobacteria bacterium]|jgi:benzoyl-CoA 2,3-dioxygenase component B|nr:benzoyl-CoA 2,3-epoxidase subunit BoxB [Actinomycetota bacterium]MBT3687280.1 benzoyl-CoA 2,3-epoxidase subunit BoxB [Actinomycetota bacterium]MBT4038137.1 benzoyl-CoA 2,3-epoxidase subunit BoxB [Actinomycetota bacterium]MBT4278841.1 benzoyl-CoA 2,3-epoxidase subunit BoxB [Actinomycetota bacterium]MBT4342925.1 benzoyl-CoA 2,3-epoxidase subunit BoxB [Actinomycetota bacterium]